MPPKNVKLENAVFYTADGRKIGKLADFEIEAPVWEHDSEIIGKVQNLNPMEVSFEIEQTEATRKFFKELETTIAIDWASVFVSRRISHLARYGKNKRIRKKNADKCLRRYQRRERGFKLWE